MTHVVVLALAPSFVKGILAVACAVVLFIGSVYLLCSAVFGLRMGYLVVATSLFAWIIVLAAIWTFCAPGTLWGVLGSPGTLGDVGPRGTEPHWQVFSAASQPTTSRFPETATYPGDGWWVPAANSTSASSVPTVTTAFQTYLAAQAQQQLEAAGQTDVQIDPTQYVVQDVRFSTAADGTHLAAGTAFFESGGPAITVYAYHDSGNVPIWSWLFLFAGLVLFLVHVPFLDRAERSRKDILTGGTAPAWYGPA
jgi:hypothetical protein